jgi:hypothetical protein
VVAAVAGNRAGSPHAGRRPIRIGGAGDARGAAGGDAVVPWARAPARVVTGTTDEAALRAVASGLRSAGWNWADQARRTAARHVAARQAQPVARVLPVRTVSTGASLCDTGAVAQDLPTRTCAATSGPIAGRRSTKRNGTGGARVATTARVVVGDTLPAARVLPGGTLGDDGRVNGDVRGHLVAGIPNSSSTVDASIPSATGGSILAAFAAHPQASPSPGARTADMLRRIAVVGAGTASARLAIEPLRIGAPETAHDTQTCQGRDHQAETGPKPLPMKTRHLH